MWKIGRLLSVILSQNAVSRINLTAHLGQCSFQINDEGFGVFYRLFQSAANLFIFGI